VQQERDGQEGYDEGGEHQQHVSESFATLFVVVDPVPQASTYVHLGLQCAAPKHAHSHEDSLGRSWEHNFAQTTIAHH